MVDPLGRIAAAARGLLDRVDAVLLGLGAPPDHPIWTLLHRMTATPGDAVAFFAAIDPDGLRTAGAVLRDLADQLGPAGPPATVPWQGSAGEAFAAHLGAMRAYLGHDQATVDADSLLGRLAETASLVEDIADWFEWSRAQLARALADVLTSAQAVTVRTGAAVDRHPVESTPDRVPTEVVVAAADIGAHLLACAAAAHAVGLDLLGRWDARLGELAYHGPAMAGLARLDATIRLRD